MRRRRRGAPVSVGSVKETAHVVHLGLADYHAVHALQLELVERRRSGSLADDIFLVTEHPRVFTLGRRGGRQHLMVPDEFLAQQNISVLPIERGGEITFHGPGQLVVYPVIHLRQAALTVGEYVFRLEELMLEIAASTGVEAGRDKRNHGVWVGNCKLGSIGIAIRHGVAFHGMAININIDLTPFSWVNPCGLTGVGMTSLREETGRDVTMEEVKNNLIYLFQKVFVRRFVVAPVTDIVPEELLNGAFHKETHC